MRWKYDRICENNPHNNGLLRICVRIFRICDYCVESLMSTYMFQLPPNQQRKDGGRAGFILLVPSTNQGPGIDLQMRIFAHVFLYVYLCLFDRQTDRKIERQKENRKKIESQQGKEIDIGIFRYGQTEKQVCTYIYIYIYIDKGQIDRSIDSL